MVYPRKQLSRRWGCIFCYLSCHSNLHQDTYLNPGLKNSSNNKHSNCIHHPFFLSFFFLPFLTKKGAIHCDLIIIFLFLEHGQQFACFSNLELLGQTKTAKLSCLCLTWTFSDNVSHSVSDFDIGSVSWLLNEI